MADEPAPGETSRTKLVRRSNKNYDELIRDYIRGARERLEAAKRSPPVSGIPHSPLAPITQQTSTTATSHHSHSISAAIALPSPSAQWPLPGHAESNPLDAASETHSPQQHEYPLVSPGITATVDLNQQVGQTNADTVPPPSSHISSVAAAQSQHRHALSSLSHSRNHSIPTIREGHASHALTPSRVSAFRPSMDSSHVTSNNQQPLEENDHVDNPFTDRGDRGLVREASIGRSHRPVLTEIVARTSQERRRSADESRRSMGAREPRTPTVPVKHIRAGVGVTDTPGAGPRSSSLADPHAFQSGTALLTPTASFSSKGTDVVTNSVPALRSQPEVEIPFRPDTAGSSQSSSASFRLGTLPTAKRQTSLSERVGSKKPARLNLDAVKEAESRGSITSLPDLISRALRLASNLERGKSASKVDDNWPGDESADKPPMKKRRFPFSSSSGSLPALPTSRSDAASRKKNGWPRYADSRSIARQGYSQSVNGDPEKRRTQRRRRCCGMPVWLFALTIVLVFVLIVAAILVPIFIIVIPEESKATNSCANGGVSITSAAGSQECICVDGYTGKICTRADDSGCASINLSTGTNATVGLQLPTVFASAATSYNINLNTTVLLPLFSALDMTCASETSLISLSGLSSRSVLSYNKPAFVRRDKPTRTVTSAFSFITEAPRQADLRARQTQALTENGIVFAQSSSSTSSTPTSTKSSSATATSTASSTLNATSEHTLGFARTVILYILQEGQDLTAAESAHSKLYLFLANPSAGNASDVDLGGGWSVNLEKATILTES